MQKNKLKQNVVRHLYIYINNINVYVKIDCISAVGIQSSLIAHDNMTWQVFCCIVLN